MSANLKPFLRHTLSDMFAKQVAAQLNDLDREALLLWKAHVKRIRPVPKPVMEAAVTAYRDGEERVGIQIQDAQDVALVMDKLGELVWETLDEAGRREWLLKV